MNYNKPSYLYSDVLKKFEDLEKKLQLDKSKINNVHWWDTCRYEIFNDLNIKLGLRNKSPKKETSKKFKFIKNVLINFFNFFLKNSPIWISKNANIIFGHPRRKYEDGVYIDQYVDPFIDLFPESFKFTIIERPISNHHLKPAKSKKIFYADFLLDLINIFSKFIKFELNHDNQKILSNLEKNLNNEFHCKVDVKNKVKNKICYWIAAQTIMSLFFRMKKPKILFFVDTVGQEAVISAAKSLKICTVELQHGSPSRGKLNYDYSSGIDKKSFPDYFLSYGKYWSSSCKFPIVEKNIIPFGNSYLYRKKKFYSKIKKENRIVILSQPAVTDLLEFTYKLAKKFYGKITIEFKPHPKEFYYNEPDYFKKLRDLGVIISEKNSDLYEILAKSRWLVGVYSTAIYEGLFFDVSIFILNVAGSENMKNLIELNIANLVSSPKDINLNWKADTKIKKDIFAEPTKKKIDFIISLAKN